MITAALLPAPPVRRWTPKKKHLIARAVVEGLLSLDIACARYSLMPEEIERWIDGKVFQTAGRNEREQMFKIRRET